jgi:hypothetical protein
LQLCSLKVSRMANMPSGVLIWIILERAAHFLTLGWYYVGFIIRVTVDIH